MKFKVEAVSYIVNAIIILGSEDIEQSAITSTPTLQAQAGAKAAKPAQAANTRHKITENVIRRSERKPKAELLEEQMEEIEAKSRPTFDPLTKVYDDRKRRVTYLQ